MRTERFSERHRLGFFRLTGDNSGLYYTKERKEETTDVDGNAVTWWVYDVYVIDDMRFPDKGKSEVIKQEYPHDKELKILRKTIAKLLKDTDRYDLAEFAEFKQYNEFSEGIS